MTISAADSRPKPLRNRHHQRGGSEREQRQRRESVAGVVIRVRPQPRHVDRRAARGVHTPEVKERRQRKQQQRPESAPGQCHDRPCKRHQRQAPDLRRVGRRSGNTATPFECRASPDRAARAGWRAASKVRDRTPADRRSATSCGPTSRAGPAKRSPHTATRAPPPGARRSTPPTNGIRNQPS